MRTPDALSLIILLFDRICLFIYILTGNPAPAHNGRTCVGADRLEMYCSNLPPCPEPRKPAIDGSWGPYGLWSKCTVPCGGGFRMRRRLCDSPPPQNGGAECNGCSIDYETCNAQKCPERQTFGPWTPWLQYSSNSTSFGERTEKRLRYICKFNSTDAKIYKAKEENRICVDKTCHRLDEDNVDSNLNESTLWSSCSSNCGGGQQFRYEGEKKFMQECNLHACKGLSN